MNQVRGTEGYARVVEKFIEATEAIDFSELHRSFRASTPPVNRANVLLDADGRKSAPNNTPSAARPQ